MEHDLTTNFVSQNFAPQSIFSSYQLGSIVFTKII